MGVERKLTAILCADVHGYSRLMGEDEEATVRTLSAHRTIIDRLIEQHRGRFVNSAGDSVLAEFASVVNAVESAVEIQTALKAENAKLPPERRMEFRIGVNLGDVVIEGEQIYGDGINVAARLESLADPGGICISGTVHAQIRNKLALDCQDLGAQRVKNIAESIHVLRVLTEPGSARRKIAARVPRNYWRHGALSLVGLVLIAAIFVVVQHLSLRPPITSASIPSPQSPAPPLPSIPSIAVLPFVNRSGDPQQEYFSDGMTDDLITQLSRVPGLFVIARASSFTYKGKTPELKNVRRELGVKYVLEGSVRKAEDRLRITAQLVDTNAGTELWGESFDRPLRDIFSLQDEIVQRIVTTLRLEIALLNRGIWTKRTTNNTEAYDYFLRGVAYYSTYSKEGNLKARYMAEKAIELDPKYADAYTLLGGTYWLTDFYAWDNSPEVLEHAFELAKQAISLDDSSPGGHCLMSAVQAAKRNYEQAVAEANRAIALDPNYAGSYMTLGHALIFSGRPEEAISADEKALRLDPRSRDFYFGELGTAYVFMGEYKKDSAAQAESHQLS